MLNRWKKRKENNFMTEKIITPQSIVEEKLAEYVFLVGKIFEKEALRLTRNKKCEKCGQKEKLKIVPLHGTPHPFPDSIVLYCANCHWNKEIMAVGKNKVIDYYFKDLDREISRFLPAPTKKKENIIKDKNVIDKLIK
jgi:late competence protein required for DNA uptake (superfamily II DNA/RNA helicase)